MKRLVAIILVLSTPLCAVNTLKFPFYVWNLGFCHLADVGPIFHPFGKKIRFMEDRMMYDADHYIENIRDGSIVWVHADKLLRFAREVIPEIDVSIYLISGGSDATFPKDYESVKELAELVDCTKILHLYMQNCDFDHPKVSQIPIGIDLHTLIHWPKRFGESEEKDPFRQVYEIQELIKTLPPTGKRKIKAICDFAFNDSMHNTYNRYIEFGEDRMSIRKKVESLGFATHLKKPVPRSVLWKMKGECAFDISPPGNGLDCHRTWESLLLGCIVIVKDTCLNPLFKDLPVIPVKSWDEITPEKLKEWQIQYSDALTNPKYRKKLYLKYWMDQIKARQARYLFMRRVQRGTWGHGKTWIRSPKNIKKS